MIAEQLERQGRAKEELNKQREEMRKERELLQDQYKVVKQLSIPKDQPDGSRQFPPHLNKFSLSRFLKSLKGSSRDQKNEGPLPSKLEAPRHSNAKNTRRLNSTPSNSGSGRFTRSYLTMSMSRLEGKRTPSPDKRISLPSVGHKRHGSDELKYRDRGEFV